MISIIAIAVLVVLYIIIGRQIPIHRSDLKVGTERIYYHETSRLVQCDLAFTEVIVYEEMITANMFMNLSILVMVVVKVIYMFGMDLSLIRSKKPLKKVLSH